MERERPARLTDAVIHDAARDVSHETFVLGGRTFKLKHLAYDDYIEFMKLATPVIEAVAGVLKPNFSVDTETGKADFDFDFNTEGLDMKSIFAMAGDSLPRMVWLICRQTDKTVTVEEVKELAGKPFVLIEIVMKQVKYSSMVQDFADFFRQTTSQVADLVPSLVTNTEG